MTSSLEGTIQPLGGKLTLRFLSSAGKAVTCLSQDLCVFQVRVCPHYPQCLGCPTNWKLTEGLISSREITRHIPSDLGAHNGLRPQAPFSFAYLPSLEAASLVVTERPLPGPAEGPGLGRSHHTRCTLDTLNTWQEWALLLII